MHTIWLAQSVGQQRPNPEVMDLNSSEAKEFSLPCVAHISFLEL